LMSRVGTLLAVSLLMAVTIVSSGCASSAPSANSGRDSGVLGIVLFTGGLRLVTPSPLPSGFGSNQKGTPWSKSMVEIAKVEVSGEAHVVERIRPNGDGVFRQALPPGRYTLRAFDVKDPAQRIGRHTRVEVTEGRYARAVVVVDGF